MPGIDTNAIASALRNRLLVPDAQFDRVFPTSQRFRSHCHWTPVDVALRACALLAPRPGQRVLDVGSGVGKLCLVGGLTSKGHWVGVETDAHMVRAAADAASRLRISPRVQFLCGDANALDWTHFDAIYMFNPYVEGLFRSDLDPIGRGARFTQQIERAQVRLASMRPGTRFVTYHGFGGEIPDQFDLVLRERAREDHLCLWIRSSRRVLSTSMLAQTR